QIYLHAAMLVGRRAEELDVHFTPRRIRRRDQIGPDVADRYQIVTAAVSHLRERVVLGEQSDGWTGRRTHSRAKCRLQPADVPLDAVAGALEECDDRRLRVALLVRELGMSMDVP